MVSSAAAVRLGPQDCLNRRTRVCCVNRFQCAAVFRDTRGLKSLVRRGKGRAAATPISNPKPSYRSERHGC
eukprot:7240649-Alexandrium_andersonii.AAC.1